MKLKRFWNKYSIVILIAFFVAIGALVGVLAWQLTKVEPKNDPTSYTIQFLDYDGGVFDTQTVSDGQDATAPSSNPTKIGYSFNGWEDYTNVTGDRVVKSKWVLNESYLRTDWMSALTAANSNYTGSSINAIEFTTTAPSTAGYTAVSVGATTSAGTTAFVSGTFGVSDIIAYVKANSTNTTKYDIVFYSPVKIYAPTTSSYLFSSESGEALTSLSSISFNNFDTTKATEMSGMFKNCNALTNLDLSSFDMLNVTNTTDMLDECNALTTIKAPKAMNESTSITLPATGNFSSNGSSSTTISSSNIGQTLVLEASETENKAYLHQNWLSALRSTDIGCTASNINSIKFVSTAPTGDGYTIVSVGATAEDGLTAWTTSTTGVSDVTAYIKTNESDLSKFDVIIYSAVTIYAPSNSSYLFGAWDNGFTALKSISFNNFDTSNVTSMSCMFENCVKLTSLDLSGFNTSKVTDMSWLFYGCKKLSTINLTSFNTSKVTDMEDMFYLCNALTELNLSNFDTSKVTTMLNMFYECENLTSLNISSFNTSKVTTMAGMFYKCSELTSLDLSNFDTSKVTSMYDMFANCVELLSVDLSSFNTENVSSMQSMFNSCFKLVSLDLTNFDTSSINTSLANMFYSCYALTSIDLSSFDLSNASDATDMFKNCSSLAEIKTPSAIKNGVTISLPDGTWVESTNELSIQTSISNSNVNKKLILTTNTFTITFNANGGSCSTATKTVVNGRLYGSLPEATPASSDYSFVGWFTAAEGGTQITELSTVSLDSNITLYAQYTEAEVIVTVTLDNQSATAAGTTNIYYKHGTNVYYSDPECTEVLTSITVPTKTEYTFGGYFTEKNGKGTQYIGSDGSFISTYFSNLSMNAENQTLYANWSLVASYLKTSWRNAITSAISTCTAESIKTIQFTKTAPVGSEYTTVSVGATAEDGKTAWNSSCGISDVIAYVKANSSDSTKYDIIFYSPATICAPSDSSHLFSNVISSYRLTGLTSISFDNFNTSKVTDMSNMFSYCTSLTTIDHLSNFDTSNVTNMYAMFNYCNNLTSVDLSSFDTTNVTDMKYMFTYCNTLTSIDLSNFNTTNVTNVAFMFSYCSNLTSLDLSSFNMTNVTGTGYMLDHCSALTTIKAPSAMKSSITIELPSGTWKTSYNNSTHTTITPSEVSSNGSYTLTKQS